MGEVVQNIAKSHTYVAVQGEERTYGDHDFGYFCL